MPRRAAGGARHCPRTKFHVVTVPPRGAPPDVLWRRFASVLELDADRLDVAQSVVNSSLSAEHAELLRRINTRLADRLPMPGPYVDTVKEVSTDVERFDLYRICR